jgi:hypothetical protein
MYLSAEQRRTMERGQQAALDAARQRREEGAEIDRQWKDAARSFTPDEAHDELTALASRRDAGDLTPEQHDTQAASVKARTIAPPRTLADRMTAMLGDPSNPIDKLSDEQVDALWYGH